MTEKEKEYYNLYLSVSRSSVNKPFKLRKNFDGFEDKPEYLILKKIVNFLNKFPNIKPREYFQAPFKVYEDEDYFDLHFYATQKAVKAYSLYMKQKQEQSPDSEDQLDFIKESLRFIGMFCIKNNIPIEQYTTYKEGITYAWMNHYRKHDITIYALFALPNLISSLNNIQEDEKDLFLGDVGTTIYSYLTRYHNSKTAKKLVEQGTNKISQFVSKNLKKSID